MKELLGVIVLSMPILVVLCIGGLAGYAGWAAARRVENVRRKWIAKMVAILAVTLVFTWDEIAGRLYLEFLCTTDGGAKIFKQVTLPPEYWRADGSPIFIDEKGNKIASQLDEQYRFASTSNENYSRVFRIRQYVNSILDRQDGFTIGKYTYYSFFGGWLVNYASLDVTGVGCPDKPDFYGKFLRSTFVR